MSIANTSYHEADTVVFKNNLVKFSVIDIPKSISGVSGLIYQATFGKGKTEKSIFENNLILAEIDGDTNHNLIEGFFKTYSSGTDSYIIKNSFYDGDLMNSRQPKDDENKTTEELKHFCRLEL